MYNPNPPFVSPTQTTYGASQPHPHHAQTSAAMYAPQHSQSPYAGALQPHTQSPSLLTVTATGQTITQPLQLQATGGQYTGQSSGQRPGTGGRGSMMRHTNRGGYGGRSAAQGGYPLMQTPAASSYDAIASYGHTPAQRPS
jgi:hypothetical protein